MAISFVHGTVESFGNSGYKYGFITHGDGKSIFFHRNALRSLNGKAGQITWAPVPDTAKPRDPRAGDKVVFEIGTDRDGRPCATSWTFVQIYDQAVVLAAKPVAPEVHFRLARRRRMVGADWSQPEELWRGTDPNSESLRPHWSPDPRIRMSFSSEDGWDSESWFEFSIDNGKTWTRCAPPTHLMRRR